LGVPPARWGRFVCESGRTMALWVCPPARCGGFVCESGRIMALWVCPPARWGGFVCESWPFGCAPLPDGAVDTALGCRPRNAPKFYTQLNLVLVHRTVGVAKQASAAGIAGGGSWWQQAGSGSKQAGLASRTVLCAANRSHPIMAGSRARGRRSVAIWLTRSAVSICIATDRLHSSPLVQSLPMRRTLHTFNHFPGVTSRIGI